jgi:hypothetical protein
VFFREYYARARRLRAQRRLIDGRFTPEVTTVRPAGGGEVSVLMCLWNRPGRIDEVIDLLDAQSGTAGVNLHLWNNQANDHDHYRRAIAAAVSRLGQGALQRIELTRSPYNTGSIGRFFIARSLARGRAEAPVIVLDDDQDIRPDFVARALDAYDPDVVAAWWAWNVREYYWDRDAAPAGAEANYVGPGGSIMSDRLFLDETFFTAIPERFRWLDDIWLSHRARAAGLRLIKLDVEIDFVLEETNQYRGQADLKPEFWSVLSALRASSTP